MEMKNKGNGSVEHFSQPVPICGRPHRENWQLNNPLKGEKPPHLLSAMKKKNFPLHIFYPSQLPNPPPLPPPPPPSLLPQRDFAQSPTPGGSELCCMGKKKSFLCSHPPGLLSHPLAIPAARGKMKMMKIDIDRKIEIEK